MSASTPIASSPSAMPIMATATPIYPVAQAFSAVPVKELPYESWGPYLSPQLWGILAASKEFTIRQQLKVMPEGLSCSGCPPPCCIPQANTYFVYAGLTQESNAMLLRVDEVSDGETRCCCAPHHPFKLEVRQYIPKQDECSEGSDWSNIAGDISQDFSQFSGNERHEAQRNAYMQQPVAMSILRDGTQYPGCCNKCLGCVVCTGCCADGMTLVTGAVDHGDDAKSIGQKLIDNIPQDRIVGSAIVPIFGGCCTPTINVKSTSSGSEPFGKVEGPTCFGGCSEFCCDFEFPISSFDSAAKAGDFGKITKLKPTSMGGAFLELFSDADVFKLEFADETLTPEQKATFLSTLLLTDYMFFEGKAGDKCGTDSAGRSYINLCNCYFMGCLVPCMLKEPPKDG